MEFKVRFITPLLIHGANPRQVDAAGLTGKALRGCWRFWFRAAVCGLIDNVPPLRLRDWESRVFGSADEKFGAKFRLLVQKGDDQSQAAVTMQFSRGPVTFFGLDSGCEFIVNVTPRTNNMDIKELNALIASIWLWGNLGGIGQRERRGFGSPVLIENSDKPFSKLLLPTENSFSSHAELDQHLKKGLARAWEILSEFLETKVNPIASNALPSGYPNDCFVLGSFKQVAVCASNRGPDVRAVLQHIHGTNLRGQSGFALGNERFASPIFLRVHMINNKFYPVVTWSHPDNTKNSRARTWLEHLGFEEFMSGDRIKYD